MTISKISEICDKVHSHKAFQLFVTAIIVLSAILIGASTFDIDENLLLGMKVLDYTITIIFVFEIVIRMIVAKSIRAFFSSWWNVFDLAIVIGSLIPFDDNMVMLGRLLRVFRVLRLITVIPELRILISALIKSLPPMGYVLLLMFIIFYVYAAVGSAFFHDINPTLWGNVAISLLTLFRVVTFEDWTDVMYETMEVYPLSWIFYLSFIFLNAFVFLNMMIGIVLDKMQSEHNDEPDSEMSILNKKLDAILKKVEKLEKNQK